VGALNLRRVEIERKCLVSASVLAVCGVFVLTILFPVSAWACSCVGDSQCITDHYDEIRDEFDDQRDDHEDFLLDDFFTPLIEPMLRAMTQQQAISNAQEFMPFGMFLDAVVQLDTQLLFRKLTTEALSDYQPSHGLCIMGTTIRSLSPTHRNVFGNVMTITRRMQQRDIGNQNSSGGEGPGGDMKNRMQQFITRYCDPQDNNALDDVAGTGLQQICESAPTEFVNKDIDYTRTIDIPKTLDMNLTDNNLTDDDQDVFALSSNLFTNHVPRPLSAQSLKNNSGGQELYLDLRSLAAKRSVAQTSFAEIAAMKAQGSEGAPQTMEYIRLLLNDLGMTDDEIDAMYGERPSYFAQMEILTKKVYQNPQFYADIYDTPANVKRKSVAMQAIGSMLKNDIYRSKIRSEMLMSLLLEMEVAKAAESAHNRGRQSSGVERQQ
jgi:hypothetical protein